MENSFFFQAKDSTATLAEVKFVDEIEEKAFDFSDWPEALEFSKQRPRLIDSLLEDCIRNNWPITIWLEAMH